MGDATLTNLTLDRIGPPLLTGALRLLMVTVWISSGLFALYIVGRYLPGLVSGELSQWNSRIQPQLVEPEHTAAAAGLGLHLFTGALVLLLGSIQFIAALRARWPQVHRVTGRIYIGACLLMAVGGMVHIVSKGTVGGVPMNVAFFGYGLAMLVCAVLTLRHAMARSLQAHRAWAIRLYALAIGSWLYRMYYGLIFATGVGGIQNDFQGPVDLAMNYLFWVPNLVLAELVIRGQGRQAPGWLSTSAGLLIVAAGLVIAFASYFATRIMWAGPILGLLRGDFLG
jgi:hypothetical protein